jgi:hypothetical protein
VKATLQVQQGGRGVLRLRPLEALLLFASQPQTQFVRDFLGNRLLRRSRTQFNGQSAPGCRWR